VVAMVTWVLTTFPSWPTAVDVVVGRVWAYVLFTNKN